MEFFKSSLKEIDVDIYNAIAKEKNRQQDCLELIASENIVSKAVLEALGSILTNKYAEGYPKKRYYGGCQYVDIAESLAIERAKQLFNCEFVNVQPHSGSQANQAVFLSLLKPGDTILGMSLDAGGHLTHGSPVNQSGKWFNAKHYGVDQKTFRINYDEVEFNAKKYKPKVIIAGHSAYPRELDFKKFREIADSINAYLMVDMAHIAGLVATGFHQSPIPHADVVTTTTHKTLRGPRGGMILTNNKEIAKAINSAVFPGMQGGPLMHVIAAKATAFKEALQDSYKEYIKNVIENCRALATTLNQRGFDVLTGGTDSHLLIVDLRNKSITGKDAEIALDEAHLTCNKNSIPFDTESFVVTSGIRLGSAACTTRGLRKEHFKEIGNLIADTLDNIKDESAINSIKSKVLEICNAFPIY
ncbi:MAG: serine hydroxymethyltransferase [Proteobacteria bacterium]|nr:serine hydroxymethyltransferase [Pseudomonadota bacterium]